MNRKQETIHTEPRCCYWSLDSVHTARFETTLWVGGLPCHPPGGRPTRSNQPVDWQTVEAPVDAVKLLWSVASCYQRGIREWNMFFCIVTEDWSEVWASLTYSSFHLGETPWMKVQSRADLTLSFFRLSTPLLKSENRIQFHMGTCESAFLSGLALRGHLLAELAFIHPTEVIRANSHHSTGENISTGYSGLWINNVRHGRKSHSEYLEPIGSIVLATSHNKAYYDSSVVRERLFQFRVLGW